MSTNINIAAKEDIVIIPKIPEHQDTKKLIGFFEQVTQLTKFCFADWYVSP